MNAAIETWFLTGNNANTGTEIMRLLQEYSVDDVGNPYQAKSEAIARIVHKLSPGQAGQGLTIALIPQQIDGGAAQGQQVPDYLSVTECVIFLCVVANMEAPPQATISLCPLVLSIVALSRRGSVTSGFLTKLVTSFPPEITTTLGTLLDAASFSTLWSFMAPKLPGRL